MIRRSVFVVAAAIFLVTHATNMHVPLFGTYAEMAGFGSSVSTLAFAAYVAGLLPTLILLGGLSDRAGRKQIILTSLLILLGATGLMMAQPNIYALFVTRVLQGIGVGFITGTGAAYLSHIMPKQSAQVATYVSFTTSLGFSSGALFTNFSLWISHSLVPFNYVIVFCLLIACVLSVMRLAEQPVSDGKLIRLPAYPAGTVPVGFAIAFAWSLAGIVSVILPEQLMQFGLANWAGPMLFVFVISGVLLQSVARRLSSEHSLTLGCVLLLVGYLIFTVGARLGAIVLVLLGVAISGTACYGFTYLGGMSKVIQLSGTQSARAVSGYFMFAYLGFGLPVVLIGFLAERLGTTITLFGYGVILLLANLVLILHLKRRTAR